MIMRLNNEPFELIKSGSKTVELRLNDEKRSLLKVNDIIEFINRKNNESLKTRIIKLHKYSSFEQLYNHFDKEKIGYHKDEIANYKDMEKYYSIEDINKYGVVGIEIEVLKSI